MFIKEKTDILHEDAELNLTNDAVAVQEMAELLAAENFSADDMAALESFCADEAGCVEIVLEMETNWHALETDMMRIQHEAIVNEAAGAGFSSTVKRYWEKVKEFFVRIWTAIKSFFTRVVNKISNKFRNAEKWYASNAASIKATEVKATTWPSVADGSALDKAKATSDESNKLSMEIGSARDVAKYSKMLGDKKWTGTALSERILGGKEKTEATVSKASIEKILKGSNQAIAILKASNGVQAAQVSGAIKVAQKGATATNQTPAEQKLDKLQVEANRMSLAFNKRVDASVLRGVNAAISEAGRVARLLKGAK